MGPAQQETMGFSLWGVLWTFFKKYSFCSLTVSRSARCLSIVYLLMEPCSLSFLRSSFASLAVSFDLSSSSSSYVSGSLRYAKASLR